MPNDESKKYPLEERIGGRETFTNRKDELDYFATWIGQIDRRVAISTAIVGHRKVGKTALLQRLYNDLFAANGSVIPFLLEIKETNLLLDEFSRLYYTSFISQLLSFKLQKWLGASQTLEELTEISSTLKLDYVVEDIKRWQYHAQFGGAVLWTHTNEAPHRLAELSGDRYLVMIDEFQYINKYIYQTTPYVSENKMTTLAGSYLGTSESRIAPMLITGSAVGMLINLIHRQLPRRFKFYELKKFKEQDTLELGYKFSHFYEVPTTEECLLLAHRLLDGHPAYLRDLFDSQYEHKDLTTADGLYETYLFEVGDKKGRILAGWEEYLDLAFSQINERNAKRIVLFLAKHSDREWSRKEIKERCALDDMSDAELEQKLQALVAGDLIAQGRTAVDYQGLGDPTFEKVFRLKYEKEIEQTDFEAIRQDMRRGFAETNRRLRAEINKVRGELNQRKGEIGEFWIKSLLRKYSKSGRYFAPGELGGNQESLRLPLFRKVERYALIAHGSQIHVDVLCEPFGSSELYLAVEVKNRQARKVSADEISAFSAKLQALRDHLGQVEIRGLYYSFSGFQAAAMDKLQELELFWWDFAMLDRLK